MRKNILFQCSEEDKGFTLIEVLIATFVFTFVCFTSIFILKNSLLSSRKKTIEKEILKEIIYVSEFIENRISNAMINDLKGDNRMNFKGEKTWVKFIAPFSEDKEGDLVKFGIYWNNNKIMVQMVRIDSKNPDFRFFEGFPGAQVLGEDIKEFNLKYFDGKIWKDNWDTEFMKEPVLPELIEIKIVVSKGKMEGKEIEKEIKKIIKIGW
ncbi:MAG: type II secretion system protein GspJ [bacterium]|nr:type II secretion system protein GspJ [bacterium]MCX7916723.1 type II secretion system protein GspJ [bacterium]MDW8164747.1 prepilin-type N-terminal cleavage/methylation domain-containing protein [Candidatus Omnitrophota bacterium]